MEYYERLDPALHRRLTSLPIRGVVAAVARYARRLVPRYALASDVSSTQLEALNRAIGYAEGFVEAETRGSGFAASIDAMLPPDDYPADEANETLDPVASQIAIGVNAIHDLLIYAAKIREIAAETVPDLATSTIVKLRQSDLDGSVDAEADKDFELILRLYGPDRAGFFGEPLDPTQSGPLGSLWKNSPPQWFVAGQQRIMDLLGHEIQTPEYRSHDPADTLTQRITESHPEPFIQVCFDDSGFTADEIELFLSYVSEVYRDLGGIGLKVVHTRTLLPRSTEVRS